MNPDSGIRRRIVRAVGAEALGQGLNIGTRLLLVPLFLAAWGAQAYGEWLTLTAVAAWFGLADLGGQLYFVNRLTAAWAAGRRDESQRVLSTGLLGFAVIATALFGVTVLVLSLLPSLGWLGLQVVAPDVARLLLAIAALRFLVALPVGLLTGVFRSTTAQATSVMYGNLALALQFAGTAAALLAGAGMLVVAAVDVAAQFVVALAVSVDLRRRLPADIRVWAPRLADLSVLRSSLSPSLHFLTIQLAMALMVQGSVIVVAATLGSVQVAIFSTVRTVSNVVSRLLAMLSHSAWPEFTRLDVGGRTATLLRLFRSILFIALLGGLLYLVVVEAFGAPLFRWWLRGALVYDPTVMYLMGSLVILTTIWTLGGNLLMATNRHELFARLQLPVNLCALALCYAGALGRGLTGAVIGLLIGQSVLMTAAVVALLRRNGFDAAATTLFRVAMLAVLLLPLCLNVWTGLAGVVAIALMTARQLDWANVDALAARAR